MIQRGFNIIELMVVILLLGIITAVGFPRLFYSAMTPTEDFIGRLNALIDDGVYAAQSTQKAHRVFFDLLSKKVEIQTTAGKPVYRAISIPQAVDIEEVLINGKSPFSIGGGEKRTVYFLINPEGISQEVELHILDQKVKAKNPTAGVYTFYLNPFTSVFRVK